MHTPDSARGDAPGRRRRRPALPACGLAVLLLAACSESFSPVSPTGLQYSVFGYLDASADTQWIRVMPIRDLAITFPDSFGARVTIQPLGTGQTIELRDSLFRYQQGPDVGSAGVYLHNYWTTERIRPGGSYLVAVQRPGLAPAEVEVKVPGAYWVELWLRQQGASAAYADELRVSGVAYLPFASETSTFYDRCGYFVDRIALTVPRAGADGVRSIAPKKTGPQQRGCGSWQAEQRLLWVAGSEAEWPAGQAYAVGNLGPPEGASNVSHAVGFVGGVLTTQVPYDSCALSGPAPLPPVCKLRYDDKTASIEGLVTETRCGLGPFDTLQVSLTEVAPDAGGHRRIRPALTNRSGHYAIGGLEPGKHYSLRARPPTTRGSMGEIIDLFSGHADTLVFLAGERKRYDIGLRRLDDCSVR